MKYRVTITQDIKYRDSLVAEFADIVDAYAFVKMAFENCKNISAKFEVIEEESEEEANG